ncbi:uncharacterized protein LOC144027624 [Festucalex cinctus]
MDIFFRLQRKGIILHTCEGAINAERDSPAYFSKTWPSRILYVLQQHDLVEKDPPVTQCQTTAYLGGTERLHQVGLKTSDARKRPRKFQPAGGCFCCVRVCERLCLSSCAGV